jgi:hypothetical protein
MLLESSVTTLTPLTQSNDFIHIYTADPAVVLCDEIIGHSEQGEWNRSLIFNSDEPILDQRDSYQQSYSVYDHPDVHRPMLDFASSCLNNYLEAFPQANKQPSFSVAERYQVLRYLDGGAYHTTHTDYHPHAVLLNRRHLTGVGFLNDVKTGGQLLFPQQNFFVNPEAGKFVIFPSGWTHAHKTLPPVGQSRYVFQMWWSFNQPDEVTE